MKFFSALNEVATPVSVSVSIAQLTNLSLSQSGLNLKTDSNKHGENVLTS